MLMHSALPRGDSAVMWDSNPLKLHCVLLCRLRREHGHALALIREPAAAVRHRTLRWGVLPITGAPEHIARRDHPRDQTSTWAPDDPVSATLGPPATGQVIGPAACQFSAAEDRESGQRHTNTPLPLRPHRVRHRTVATPSRPRKVGRAAHRNTGTPLPPRPPTLSRDASDTTSRPASVAMSPKRHRNLHVGRYVVGLSAKALTSGPSSGSSSLHRGCPSHGY